MSHGGLTPPAPGCTTFVRCIKRHWQCTYARRPRAAGVSPPWLGKRVSSGETLDIYVAIQNRYPTRNTCLQRRDPEQTEDWLARVSVVGFQNGGVPIYRPIATSGLDSKSVVQSLVCWRSWPNYEEVEVCSCKCNPCKRSWPSYEGVEGNPRTSPPRWRIRNRDWRL
jgi:hypothetical protein